MIQMSGSHSIVACMAALALWVIGAIFLFARPNLRLRSAYLMASLIPGISGITGFATGLMRAFSVLGTAGMGDALRFFAALGEIVLPMMFGFIGSGVALMIGALIWMRRERELP